MLVPKGLYLNQHEGTMGEAPAGHDEKSSAKGTGCARHLVVMAKELVGSSSQSPTTLMS